MTEAPRLRSAVAVALAMIGCGGLAACGGDDEPEPATGISDARELETTTEATTADPETTTTQTAPPEAHEGGGPDPGTDEAENAAENAAETVQEESGGTGAQSGGGGQGGSGSGGASPTDAFDQFCEDNPQACE